MLQAILRRPLSALTGLGSLLVIFYALALLLCSSRYAPALNYVDITTLIMIGVLFLRGITALRGESDLQAVSISLVSALSFVFSYEALYKWSFYRAPFAMGMPPGEFRELVIQIGVALTVLTGFAAKDLRFNRATWVFLGLLALAWLFWMLCGFGQIFQKSGETMFHPLLPISLSSGEVYIVNRATKVLLFLAYFSLHADSARRSNSKLDSPEKDLK